jgi:hypothetical protein
MLDLLNHLDMSGEPLSCYLTACEMKNKYFCAINLLIF